ncbi:cinnamoyl-CoA reductase-like SNL6 [Momordica charantia]|uniref:Cinnamoyl-CoA reductase-like SNL6 n=1 Tax=Momordica charantia TaxID=3673 RepID=A0A6J1DD48_MOMCH|nr:cinnamoyl-CoA reductase-like SNL6 [Momordica charantia]
MVVATGHKRSYVYVSEFEVAKGSLRQTMHKVVAYGSRRYLRRPAALMAKTDQKNLPSPQVKQLRSTKKGNENLIGHRVHTSAVRCLGELVKSHRRISALKGTGSISSVATYLSGSAKSSGESSFRSHWIRSRNGVSVLGLAVVNQLLQRGYSVRIVLDNPEDIEKVREMESEAGGVGVKVSTVAAKLREGDGLALAIAFEGCRGVFHTSSFIDPAGLTGYSKAMVEVEEKVSENVVEACARTSSVRYCVFTSSLLACIWRSGTRPELPPVVDHDCWSDQSLCVDKKLWYALGKLRAEKAAWRIAKERDLKLVTICPGFVTSPNLSIRNSTPTIAYLKGAPEMFDLGILATVSVQRLAEAHVNVYEAMGENRAHGRYICFDQIITTQAEAEDLATEIGVDVTKIYQSQEASTSGSASGSKFDQAWMEISRCERVM